MSKKYYAVVKGRNPGIYTSWQKAKKQIHKYSNAVYKGFKTKEEAEKFMATDTEKKIKRMKEKHQAISIGVNKLPNNIDNKKRTVIAYVDGSFDKKNKLYSSGAVMLDEKEEVVDKLTQVGARPDYLESHQIAGETLSAILAIKWAIKNNYEQIIIHYDYIGIEKWAKGEWKAYKPVSKKYIEELLQLINKIDIFFYKVKGHSGDVYNDMADNLARIAIDRFLDSIKK